MINLTLRSQVLLSLHMHLIFHTITSQQECYGEDCNRVKYFLLRTQLLADFWILYIACPIYGLQDLLLYRNIFNLSVRDVLERQQAIEDPLVLMFIDRIAYIVLLF